MCIALMFISLASMVVVCVLKKKEQDKRTRILNLYLEGKAHIVRSPRAANNGGMKRLVTDDGEWIDFDGID